MGRASRWLRGLFGGKKSPNPNPKPNPNPNPNPNPKEKNNKRWGIFVKSFREKDHDDRRRVDDSYRRVDDDDEEEQNKRATAVAAAAVAVAAAQASAAVVRLTSAGGRGGKRAEDLAAVKIQAAFRAYLARRALRALKGLVKLQALVRGNIVRKQAAETLRCMQALVRVQARARACRALRSDVLQHNLSSQNHPGPSTPEKCEQPIRARANAHKPDRSSTLKRNSSKQASTNVGGLDQDQPQSSGLRWLDQWMEEHYWDTTKSSTVAMSTLLDNEKNAKILEIDTGKPHNYNPVRKSNNYYIYSSHSDQHSHSFNTVPESPSKDSTIAHSPSSVGFPMCYDFDESPQFFSPSSSRPVSSRLGPFTPSKSECSRSLFSGYADFPNYMSYTESSRAKVRSHSAPKQRPEYEKSGSIRRGFGHGLGQQSNLGQRSSLHPFANKCYPGSGRLDRLGMTIKI